MRQCKASAVFALALVLGGSACTAGDTVGSVKTMQEGSAKEALVAGVELADSTRAPSDITFHVSNDSDAAIDMLIWNTPLEPELSADVFTVTLDGVPVAYLGRLMKRSTPGATDYVKIQAHERIEAVVDLALYYEMSAPGEYQVRFTPAIIDGQTRLNEQTSVQLDTNALTVRINAR